MLCTTGLNNSVEQEKEAGTAQEKIFVLERVPSGAAIGLRHQEHQKGTANQGPD